MKASERPPAAVDARAQRRRARETWPPLLALQRRAGNRAVTQLVQRKVGFELEDTNWRAWIQEPDKPPRPAERKEHLHDGTNFTLEADDTKGKQNPSIEFVTDPFDTTRAGLGDLSSAFDEVIAIMNRLGPLAGRQPPYDFDPEKGRMLRPDKAGPTQIVRANEHGLKPHVVLFAGAPQAEFKMQATQGVSLEDLPTLMKYLGTPTTESPLEKLRRGGARHALYEGKEQPATDDDRQLATVLGDAPSLADQAIGELRRTARLVGDAARLRGFLSQVILYVKLLTVPRDLAKYAVPLLARTDFATMYALLPAEQQVALRAGDGAVLAAAVAHAAGSTQVLRRRVEGTTDQYLYRDSGFGPDRPVLRDPKYGLEALTLQNWLEGVSRAEGAVDYLNPTTMADFLSSKDADLSGKEIERRTGFLESFGVVGEASPSRKTDTPEIPGRSALALFETRAIAGNWTAEQAKTLASNYLRFAIGMRTTAGNPGKYPESFYQDWVAYPFSYLKQSGIDFKNDVAATVEGLGYIYVGGVPHV